MASWKKVIVSGSAAELASLTLDTDLAVAHGGTGQSTLSSGQVLLGNGTSGITSVARANLADAGSGKVVVANGTSAVLGASSVTLDIAGDVASGSKLNDISLLTPTDGNFIVGNNTTWVAESGATARTSLGLGSTDNVIFNQVTASIVSASYLRGDGSGITGLVSSAVTTYTNATDNRVITSTGASDINGEANLTFDGSTLTVTGRADISSTLTASLLNLDGTLADGAGEASVLVIDEAGNVKSDEIDSRVWGTSLVDYTGTPASGQIAYWSDTNTLQADAQFSYNGATDTLTVGTSTFGTDVIVAGDLTVQGDTFNLNVTNLNVEDQFILLNSGSGATSADGGIIVRTETTGTGSAFGWDDSEARFGFQIGTPLAANATAMTPDAYVSSVVTSDLAAYQKVGNIRLDGETIYIYS